MDVLAMNHLAVAEKSGLSNIDAINIIEGITQVESDQEALEAWQQVVNEGLVQHLQGSYQAAAAALIHAGMINGEGWFNG